MFCPLEGLLPGRFPQSLEESGLRSVRQRVDFPTGWKNQDAETPVDGWIPPPTGCFAPLKGLLSG